MDDKTYIALLEELLDDRKAYINELVEICGNLVKERDELAERLDQCETDYENMRDNYAQSVDRFDDLFEDYHILDQEHCEKIKENVDLKKRLNAIFSSDSKEESICKLREERKRLKDEIADLKTALSEAVEDATVMSYEQLDDYEKISGLMEDNVRLAKENNELKKEIRYLNSIIDGENA